MIGKFLVMVESLAGDFITAFSFEGRMDEAIQKGRERAYQRNVARADVTVQPIANT